MIKLSLTSNIEHLIYSTYCSLTLLIMLYNSEEFNKRAEVGLNYVNEYHNWKIITKQSLDLYQSIPSSLILFRLYENSIIKIAKFRMVAKRHPKIQR